MTRAPTIVAILLWTCCPASASPITFLHEGIASGTLDGTAFSGAFAITAFGDTENRRELATEWGQYGWDLVHTAAFVEIAGLGSFQFLIATRTFVNWDNPSVGFSRALDADLFDGPTNAAFASWDMDSSIGPVNGSGILIQWTAPFDEVLTTGGVLAFDFDEEVNTRFTATVVPAPPVGALLGVAFFAATHRRRDAR